MSSEPTPQPEFQNEPDELKARLLAAEQRALQAENEMMLLRSEIARTRHFEELVGYAPVVLWESWFIPNSEQQRVNFVSDYIKKFTGYAREEWLAGNTFWADLIHPDDRERILAECNAAIATGSGNLEYRWVRKDGSIVWAITQMSTMYDEAGRPVGVRGVTMDIDARKQAEAKREQILAREASLDAQAQALAELSTPVIPISDQVMIMPLVGTMDARRAERAISVLLSGLSQAKASVVILDITGVPQVDAGVAEALVRAARAVKLLGAEVVLTGISPFVAQMLVEMGTDLGSVVTQGTLQGGVAYAMGQAGRGEHRQRRHRTTP